MAEHARNTTGAGQAKYARTLQRVQQGQQRSIDRSKYKGLIKRERKSSQVFTCVDLRLV